MFRYLQNSKLFSRHFPDKTTECHFYSLIPIVVDAREKKARRKETDKQRKEEFVRISKLRTTIFFHFPNSVHIRGQKSCQ